jgi:phosphoribulokinase
MINQPLNEKDCIKVSPKMWIDKFGKIVTPFVDSLVPKDVSGVYHIDEMMVHVRKEHHEKGHYPWLWNMMDNTLNSGLVQRYPNDVR